jgi:putative ABC transport system ATP-binding protein
MSDLVVDVRAAEQHYPTPGGLVRAVNGIDLRVEAGECVAIMGPSGSGKSTLLALLGALEPATGGSVKIIGVDVGALTPEDRATFRREHVGFVFQDLGLLPFLTAAENVAFGIGVAGVPDPMDPRDALQRLGLEGRADRLADQLSGGEQERVAIARCLAHRPQLVVGDEPTGSLDAASSEVAIDFLLSAVRELGSTAIVVTHDPKVASHFARTVELRDGRLAHEAAPGGVQSTPC